MRWIVDPHPFMIVCVRVFLVQNQPNSPITMSTGEVGLERWGCNGRGGAVIREVGL